MTRSIPWLFLAFASTLAHGCGDDKDAASTDGASSVASNSASNSATNDATSGASDPTDSAGGTTGAAAFEPVPALGGIEVEWVEANQGVGVEIGRDGAGVDGPNRTSYLIQKRLTLFRAFWKALPADWVPRPIEARLIVKYPDGTEKVQSNTTTVEGESFVGSLEKGWYWGLMKDEVVPGLTYRVELWETEAGYAMIDPNTPAGANPPKMPYSGEAFVGIEDSKQALKIVIVPFPYNDGKGCNTTPDTSEATMQKFRDFMYMMNPIDELVIDMHDPIPWNTPLSDFDQLNSFMSGLRADENAPPNYYYFGLVDVCSGGLGGAGGKAYGIPKGGPNASKADAWQRVSSGLSLPKDSDWSSETFVHEVGHSQGRYHVHCDGEGGPDWSYPYDNGEIGEWGFGVINYKLYHPTVHRDYMTYCHPVWASTFAWNKTYPTIKALTSWDAAGAAQPDEPTGSILVGSIYPDGKETWITVPGDVHDEDLSAVHGVEFMAGGEKLARHPAAWLPEPDGDIVHVVARLPAGFERATEIVRVSDALRTTTKVEAISQHHRPQALANQ